MQKKYHIIVIGCQMNKADAERIATYLDSLGYSKTEDRIEADLVVLVTCGVRQAAENRAYSFVSGIKEENPDCDILLTGCLSDRKDVIERLKDKVDFFININDLTSLANKLGLDAKNEYEEDYLKILPKRDSTTSAFVPIGNGCDNFCAYCVVPYARGREKYRDATDIIEEVKALVSDGYREITLIAQNVNSYSSGNNTSEKIDFPDLLKMVNDITGDFWLRFLTSHPKDMSDKLIDTIASCKKVCEHVHLPAQSGSNRVLQAMNRKYTIEEYQTLLDKIRKKVAGVVITTDIIVGFPGETDEDFEETCKLFEKARYDMAYVAQYSPRPGTASYKLEDDVSRDIKKSREKKLMTILSKTALVNSKKMVGEIVEVLIDTKNHKGELVGHSRTQKTVMCLGSENLIGKIVKVKIMSARDYGVSGSIVVL